MNSNFFQWTKKKSMAAAAALAMAVTPFALHAWDGAVVGSIVGIDVAPGNNLGFRIWLSGVDNMCTGGPGWGYLNEADSNYKVFVGALMMARSTNATVTVYSNLENGYCHIGYIAVR